MRRTWMFSPILAMSHWRASSTVGPYDVLADFSASTSSAPLVSAVFATSLGELDEELVLGDEVGFAVDLDEHGLAAVLREHDAAFGGNAAGLLVGLGQALLAQPFDRRRRCRRCSA